jgi:hypothetical protein
MKAVTGSVAGFAAGVAALIAVTACSSSPSASILRPAGSGSSATVANGQSPFGKNVHIEMTSWLPSSTAQAQALRATDVTTESFTGTISYFGMRVALRPHH